MLNLVFSYSLIYAAVTYAAILLSKILYQQSSRYQFALAYCQSRLNRQ
jgi:hypothetical protein